jgi:hypothetical protein
VALDATVGWWRGWRIGFKWWGLAEGAVWPVVVKCATYSASTHSRCRRFMISIRSRISRRTVPTHRSAIPFARGARTGVRRMRMTSLVNTASKALVNLVSRSRIKNLNVARRSPRFITRLRACWATHAPLGWVVIPSR